MPFPTPESSCSQQRYTKTLVTWSLALAHALHLRPPSKQRIEPYPHRGNRERTRHRQEKPRVLCKLNAPRVCLVAHEIGAEEGLSDCRVSE
jgi:hypothetical protein